MQDRDGTGNTTPPPGARSAPATSVPLPSIPLPKGGGAIRGIGEKFSANPVTGTASFTVPIYTSPGRNGFGPQLALTYDSGAGNGAFGVGWHLPLPAITRKTDKGLPRYRDAGESDVFTLSGAEDLVPVLEDGRRASEIRTRGTVTHRVEQYRPRIEGLFARIERWTNLATGIAHWRSISRDNITTVFGPDDESRIADPEAADRIFSWLIAESYDDRGNAMLYRYARENSIAVDAAAAHERNRTPRSRSVQRYLKEIRYGNRTPRRSDEDLRQRTDWLFIAALDYGEDQYEPLGDPAAPPDPSQHDYIRATAVGRRNAEGDAMWPARPDPFSSYRAGFEVRTYRRCQRALMFHRFDELGADPYLVRSTEFDYGAGDSTPGERLSFIRSVTQCGYVEPDATDVVTRGGRRYRRYLKQTLPAVEFDYSTPAIDPRIHEIDGASLEGLPAGLDGSTYQWVDLDGEGVSGILSEQGGGWYYKRNLSPLGGEPRFGSPERVDPQPAMTLTGGRAQLLDLAGDGQLDVVQMGGPVRGFYERTSEGNWTAFRPLNSVPEIDLRGPGVRFVDLDGDGHADVLVTEQDVLTWYPSLAEEGFAPAERVPIAPDEERGPRLVFADATQSIHLADFSGDGLADLVRIRNGEICYWPNLGYGRFGAKVAMDHAPWLDRPGTFDQARVRLADLDGSGTTDLVYLGDDSVRLYFNRSGNSWTDPHALEEFPPTDPSTSVTVVDLFGNSTGCLVWSSPLPGAARRPMRYIDLMQGQKPHLLVGVRNNLGAETRVTYASSTKFYLQDRVAGTPWITRLPFPVHVVERVEVYDWVSRNRFVSRYAYHHGYFDGEEREFRGFGCVEQWDTEEMTALGASIAGPVPVNLDPAMYVPPTRTRSWFHTGAYLDGPRISKQFEREYYAGASLPDTVLPGDVTPDIAREAVRALKGALLRQEIYAEDRSDAAARPYRVSERNYTVKVIQPRGPNRHAVLHTHDRETLDANYDRALFLVNGQQVPDPRVSHTAVLEVDRFGNVVRSVSVGYRRRYRDPDPLLTEADRDVQGKTLATCTINSYTGEVDENDAYRTPLACDAQTYELLTVGQPAPALPIFSFDDLLSHATSAPANRRLIERVVTRFRPDDLGKSVNNRDWLLPIGELQSRALPGETYQQAFTPELLAEIYRRGTEDLIPDVQGTLSKAGYVEFENVWWVPSGRVFYSLDPDDDAATELTRAEGHFFAANRFHDPFYRHPNFKTHLTVAYDGYDLLATETGDVFDNHTRAGELDYRVLQPGMVTDPNDNRVAVQFDALGLVTATAVMGKPTDDPRNRLAPAGPELTRAAIDGYFDSARRATAYGLLGDASSRIVYDLHRFARTVAQHPANPSKWQPAFAVTIVRTTHVRDVPLGEDSPIEVNWTHSDGFGREIQKKLQAEPGGGLDPRWVGTGWTIFNNKGMPVQQYEPFFSATHQFEFGVQAGVTTTLFYDPLDRVMATLHADHSYEKVLFTPWRQETWDRNDTTLLDAGSDPDISAFTQRYVLSLDVPNGAWKTWREQRLEPGATAADRDAATKAVNHAATPATAHADSLGRAFLTFVKNGRRDEDSYATRVRLDIEGNQRSVTDARNRVVVEYAYDMLGGRVSQSSMEAGERWTLIDATGAPARAWDSRGHAFSTEYDRLHRPVRRIVSSNQSGNADPRTTAADVVYERIEYGDEHPGGEANNLRTRVATQRDAAGIVACESYDCQGNLRRITRDVAPVYKDLIDWATQDPRGEVFATQTIHDALNRPIEVTTPDGTVVRYAYNEAGRLETVVANLRGKQANGQPVREDFVTSIDYDPKGQRTAIVYGNQVRTEYTYDEFTYRLVHLATTDSNGTRLQDLSYSYDPVGNITRIRDDAQQTVFFSNRRVEPSADYTYDPLYRLVKATGREHLGQNGGAPAAPTATRYNDAGRTRILHPADGNAMGTYVQEYAYDKAGNIESLTHRGTDPAHPGWSRTYTYDEASLLEAASRKNNRLTRTTLSPNSSQPLVEPYVHDVHGNMTSMLHLQAMEWDFKDQLQMTRRQAMNAEDVEGTACHGERTYYVYDAAGQRVKKVTEDATGNLKDERFYVGGFELYRKHGTGAFARDSVHIMDDTRRIALVETKTIEGTAAITDPLPLRRFQFSNHLGSACLELDQNASPITYEEFYPYGATSVEAIWNTAVPKRYRYTAKERDDESGLCYYGARYYACWLGRWVSCDPLLIEDGLNVFGFVNANPIAFVDPIGLKGETPAEANVVYKRVTVIDFGDEEDPAPTESDGGGAGQKDTGSGSPPADADAGNQGVGDGPSAGGDEEDYTVVNLDEPPVSDAEREAERWGGAADVARSISGAAFGILEGLGPFGLGILSGWFLPSPDDGFKSGRTVGNLIAGIGQFVVGVAGMIGGSGAAVASALAAPATGGASLAVTAGGAAVATAAAALAVQGLAVMAVAIGRGLGTDFNGQPRFESYHDVRLPANKIGKKAGDESQMRQAVKDLEQYLKENPKAWDNFSDAQKIAIKKAFENKAARIDGFTWHHDAMDEGLLQLVDRVAHKVWHYGGRAAHGGKR